MDSDRDDTGGDPVIAGKRRGAGNSSSVAHIKQVAVGAVGERESDAPAGGHPSGAEHSSIWQGLRAACLIRREFTGGSDQLWVERPQWKVIQLIEDAAPGLDPVCLRSKPRGFDQGLRANLL